MRNTEVRQTCENTTIFITNPVRVACAKASGGHVDDIYREDGSPMLTFRLRGLPASWTMAHETGQVTVNTRELERHYTFLMDTFIRPQARERRRAKKQLS